MSIFGPSPDPDRFAQTRSIMEQALSLEGEQRRSYLARACGEDLSLRSEVESLLSSFEERDFLSTLPFRLVERVVREGEPIDLIGRRVGDYEIDGHVASGGMSDIYSARRSDGRFDLQVALKILKRGLDTEELLRRFHVEQHALARLNHPAIARLLDAGSMADGRPYLVMELVEGIPINRAVALRKLTLRNRLKLFRRICEAVSYAHQRLVVHRDLKPSNILVTKDGTPKLLDFGIAKILSSGTPSLSTTDISTARPQFMTVAYASPEQLLGQPLSTATDVYSLGVVLHELLTGQRPFAGLRPGSKEHLAALEASTPHRPSRTVVTKRLDPTSELLGESENASRESPGESKPLRSLKRRLRGDLDKILLTSLRSDPRERYASVEQLSSDLDRYLQGRPVAVRRSTLLYRGTKFLRRNRVALAVAGVVSLSLLTGLILALLGFRTAFLERIESLESEAHYKEVLDFVVRMFNPELYQKAPAEVTLAEIVSSAVERVRSDPTRDTIPGAQKQTEVAKLCSENGFFDEAEELFQSALETRKRIRGPLATVVAESCWSLAVYSRSRGEPERALEYCDTAVEIYRADEDERERLTQVLNEKGAILNRLDRGEDAVQALEEALHLARSNPEIKAPPTFFVETLNNLSLARLSQGDADGAATALRQACALADDENAGFGILLNNSAKLYFSKGQLDEAEALVSRALELQRHQFGNYHRDTAVSLNNLALIWNAKGDPSTAAGYLRTSIEIYRKLLGPHHPSVRDTFFNLGTILRRAGEFEKSIEAYEESIALCNELGEASSPLARRAKQIVRKMRSK